MLDELISHETFKSWKINQKETVITRHGQAIGIQSVRLILMVRLESFYPKSSKF